MIKRKRKIPVEDGAFIVSMVNSEHNYNVSLKREIKKLDKVSTSLLVYYNTTDYDKASDRFSLIENVVLANAKSLAHLKNWIFTLHPVKLLIRHIN